MADNIQFSATCTPVETLTDGASGTHDVMAGEVGSSLVGSGTCVVSNYQESNADQGIGGSDAAGGVRYYINCVDDSATQVTAASSVSFIIIRNTGKLYSSRTALGGTVPVTGDHVLVTLVNSTTNKVAFLAPGEAFMMSIGGTGMTNHVIDSSKLLVQSYDADGATAGADDHIAVEFLAVD
tara:strand:+ start:47 stop:589 length:543 start_codon:yes stop_codon:yes gene_type:complete